jgi:hypothetical protein
MGGGTNDNDSIKAWFSLPFLVQGPPQFPWGSVHIPELYEQFTVPDRGDKVTSGIGLLYWPARLPYATGPVRQLYAGVNHYPTVTLADVQQAYVTNYSR